ncbi:hypothetical protein L211DRAFT_853950 [Terfezia boudieri ATCC MYA-4762]|uniref:WIBG Mago-binding domain-containing protein n=1 Tax=Terfezia boudieri ATCC MYA-4762 TaxID=1051890 RepID=A0A3N4LAW4_9PEZI|nr:hypothetical protein L211DRAFT_853950 [Terfezia boudieri ATCC MYA-4762]
MAQPAMSPDQRTPSSLPTHSRPLGPPLMALNSHIEVLSRRLVDELAMIALTRSMERLDLNDPPACCKQIQEEGSRTPTTHIPDTPLVTTAGVASPTVGLADITSAGPASSTASTREPSLVITPEPATVPGILCKLSPDGRSVIPSSCRPDGTVRPERRIRPGYIPPEDNVYSVRKMREIKNLTTHYESQMDGQPERPKEGHHTVRRREPTKRNVDGVHRFRHGGLAKSW